MTSFVICTPDAGESDGCGVALVEGHLYAVLMAKSVGKRPFGRTWINGRINGRAMAQAVSRRPPTVEAPV
jgi:hypothetical protein